jgi:hypothetical protein
LTQVSRRPDDQHSEKRVSESEVDTESIGSGKAMAPMTILAILPSRMTESRSRSGCAPPNLHMVRCEAGVEGPSCAINGANAPRLLCHGERNR